MKKVLILSNHHTYTYNFRKEIIEQLLDEGFKVHLVLPYGEKVELLKEMGCQYTELPLDRRGTNLFTDLKLLKNYYTIIKQYNPDVVLSYTIKPNIYGGMACRFLNKPFFPNITGLGTAVEKKSILQYIITFLYKVSLKNAHCIFFQNEDNKLFFKEKKLLNGEYEVIPGSGVNTEKFDYIDYPHDENINFMFISRIMKEKGIDQFLEAASYIKEKYPKTQFHVLGFCEENYESILNEYQNKGIIKYHGLQDDVRKFHEISHCTIHPTYYPEGISNVLLESASSGRPIITTNRVGCKEVVEVGKNGYLVEQQNTRDLIHKIEMFLSLDYDKHREMGINGREKVKKEFDRKIIVGKYIKQIYNIIN